jgi:hypothetical protein
MRHFHRTTLSPDAALEVADRFFPTIGCARTSALRRARTYVGTIGTVSVRVRSEGGHYTLIDVETDQPGESRLDHNVKRYFVKVHAAVDPAHALEAAY